MTYFEFPESLRVVNTNSLMLTCSDSDNSGVGLGEVMRWEGERSCELRQVSSGVIWQTETVGPFPTNS